MSMQNENRKIFHLISLQIESCLCDANHTCELNCYSSIPWSSLWNYFRSIFFSIIFIVFFCCIILCIVFGYIKGGSDEIYFVLIRVIIEGCISILSIVNCFFIIIIHWVVGMNVFATLKMGKAIFLCLYNR